MATPKHGFEEAKARGLYNLVSTPEALAQVYIR